MREVDVTLFGLALIPHYVDLVAGLELGLALGIENFRNRRHAFGFCADIDDDVGRGQLHHGAFDYMVVANRFLGFGLEVLERGGEIIAARCGSLGGGIFRSDTFGSLVFMSVVFMNFRGGSLWFRRGGVWGGWGGGVRGGGRGGGGGVGGGCCGCWG